MDEDDDLDFPPDATLDLLMILIAELHERGALGANGLADMAARLDLCEHADLAERLRLLPFSILMQRAFLDGGNGED